MSVGGPVAAAPRKRLLAMASGGGHWVQLLRLRPAFEGFETSYVSMFESYAEMVDGARFYTIQEASRFNPHMLIPILFRAMRILWKERPHVIVTTGAAPPLMILILGRFIGARTLWIDSIANSRKLSGSGRIARLFAHKVISQWPDVAEREGVAHWGRVL